ncbi:uncharacterized protein LOC116339242 isoform X2 [Contarinia nasturtii]|uniref:uncharacterized protein LOC116339242 isoform X2 n=1 Tax=Contarinia nasturtii TaxID=265458 RepID=UPI0012D497AF|nr:uncharacterized protein LOC116339242 isoform X2 [Contarinia nasturtii]
MPIRRRKYHGLYFHSSAPRVVTMKVRGQDNGATRQAIVIKPSNIRIWIHDKDMCKLTQVLWEGQGNRLRTEICSNNRVRKFLDAVPYVMNVIKETHTAVVENNLDELINITSPPVPKGLLSSKDVNGLTPLHKAAGLGHLAIVEYILRTSPTTATDIDATGKTPLHWANTLEIYNKLVQAGGDELSTDYRMKTANYYRNKSSELNKSLLTVIPESPRVSQSGLPPNYDWAMFDEEHNYQFIRNNFVRKSHSTYGSFNTLNGSDERNHGSAEVISTMRDDESESNDAEMLNDVETMDDGEPSNDKQYDGTADDEQETMEQNDEPPENQDDEPQVEAELEAEPEPKPEEQEEPEADHENDATNDQENSLENPEQTDDDADNENQTEMENGDAEENSDIEKADESTDIENGDAENDDGNDIENDDNHTEMENEDVQNEEMIENGMSPHIESEHQSPRDYERIDSAENHDILFIDQGNAIDTEYQVENGYDYEPPPLEDEENDNHITTIETSEIENFNDMDDLPDLEYEEEVPMEIQNMKPGSATSGKSTARESARSMRSMKSASIKSTIDDNENEVGSKPGTAEIQSKSSSAVHSANASARSITSAKSRDTARSMASAKSQDGARSVTSARSRDTAKSMTSAKSGGSAVSQKSSAKSINSQKGDEGDDEAEPMEINDENTENVENVEENEENLESEENQEEKISDHEDNDAAAEEPTESNNDDNEAAEEEKQSDHETTVANEEDNNDDNVTSEHSAEIESSENQQKITESNGKDTSDPVMEVIEGVVHGEPDNNVVQSASRFSSVDDEDNKKYLRAQTIIDRQDMEQLAAMVLSGDGQYLIGTKSSQPEIQAFIDNVPAYMNKIRRVHIAAREGSLRDLQAALDRRKFAIAKDDCSPGKCTPIHVATIFGHASILRYLGGRFPETTSAVDENGRTALHYAATIKDNGHFYNLLVHLGSSPKTVDKFGHNAEFYLNHDKSEKILSHADLLRSFGVASSAADGMLNDQGKRKAENQSGTPLFQTDEGRYLAATLGDPLIQGLTEVANSRPANPRNNQPELRDEGQEKRENQAQEQPQQQQQAEEIQQVKIKPPPRKMDLSQYDSIDDDNVSPNHAPEPAPTSDERDEHGQSVLHFACARSHGRNALIQLIEDSGVSIAYRDELYRTARDVSMQATQPENTREIDKYILSLAARGSLDAIKHLLVEGYDHIIDVHDDESIVTIAYARGHEELGKYLEAIPTFETNREKLHRAIRYGDINTVEQIIELPEGRYLAIAKNYYGRTALHIAVLKEKEEIVHYLATNIKETLLIGDNLERTALHYAMGVSSVETQSRILIKNGAKRVLKDLKGRQPSYYFMNKSDITRLQEEEEEDEL